MSTETSTTGSPSAKVPSLYPLQVCFVVDSVAKAVAFCEEHYRWGPFEQFTIDVEDASYKDWQGEKRTEVALGMAGKVQLEFLHVHHGRDTTADYQQQYGHGFQHIGISVRSRDAAIAHLEAIGATVNETREVPGVHFGFINVPTGDGMFELLETRNDAPANSAIAKSQKQKADAAKADPAEAPNKPGPLFTIDRATIATNDIQSTLAFYAKAFRWETPVASKQTLRIAGTSTTMQRYIGKAGALELEIIEPPAQGDNPYTAHLNRGSHGLVHAGGALLGGSQQANEIMLDSETLTGVWEEARESFSLCSNFGIQRSIQLRYN